MTPFEYLVILAVVWYVAWKFGLAAGKKTATVKPGTVFLFYAEERNGKWFAYNYETDRFFTQADSYDELSEKVLQMTPTFKHRILVPKQ